MKASFGLNKHGKLNFSISLESLFCEDVSLTKQFDIDIINKTLLSGQKETKDTTLIADDKDRF